MNLYEELESLSPNANGPVGLVIEAPTPHKISVLLLIQQYLKVKKSALEEGLFYPAQSRRQFCMLLLKLIQYPDMVYNDFHNLLTSTRYRIEAVHLESFERTMSNLFSVGIDALLDFAEFQNIEKMLAEEIGVSQFSVVGLYIRRVGVVLERMSFTEMLSLFKNICLYYEKGVRALVNNGSNNQRKPIVPGGILHRPETPESTGTSETEVTTEDEEDDEFDEFAEEPGLEVDCGIQERNSHSKWSPKQVDLFVSYQCDLLENNEMRALSPIVMQNKLAEIYADNPLNSAAYFLSYMNQMRLRDYFGAKYALHRAFDRSPNQMMCQYDQKQGLQYFSMNLAVMLVNFGHDREALKALYESVVLAHEYGDKRALDLANIWYYVLNRLEPLEKGNLDAQDPIQMQSLSMFMHFLVKNNVQKDHKPVELFDILMRTEEMNYKESFLEHVADSLALRSALWCVYGNYELCSLYNQQLLNLKKTWAYGDIRNSESVGKILASTALWIGLQGDFQMSAALIHHARQRFSRHPSSESWMISECHLGIQHSISCSRWYDALRDCCQLYLFDKVDANVSRAGVFIARRHFHKARRILEMVLNSDKLSTLWRVRALVLLAQCGLCEQRAPNESIALLVDASTVAIDSYMLYEHAIIDMLLAEGLMRMHVFDKAAQAIRNGMNVIYACGTIYDRAKLDFLSIKCFVAAASDNKQMKRDRFLRGLEILEHAIECFKKLEAHTKVLDVYVYIAKTLNEIGEIDERNKYALRFRRYYTEYPMDTELLGMMF